MLSRGLDLGRRGVSRRQFLQGAAGVAAMGSGLLGALPARAASGTVSMLGWQGYDSPVRQGAFLADAGIDLQVSYLANNDEILTKLGAGQRIDIVTPYMGYVPTMRDAGMIQAIDPALVPNLDKVLPLFRNDANLNGGGQLWAVPFTWGGAPMMYDPKVFATPPESWSIVLDPEFKGKFAMMDDPIGQMIIASIILHGPDNPTMLTPAQLNDVQSWLITLKRDHARLLAPSFGEAADALVRGDVQFTFGGWEAMKAWVADKGVIEFTYPNEGSYGFIDNYCIPTTAANPEAAHALCNQVLADVAQIYLGETLIQGAVTQSGIDGMNAASRAVYPYDNMARFAEKCRFYPMTPFTFDGTHTTWPQWLSVWQEVLAA